MTTHRQAGRPNAGGGGRLGRQAISNPLPQVGSEMSKAHRCLCIGCFGCGYVRPPYGGVWSGRSLPAFLLVLSALPSLGSSLACYGLLWPSPSRHHHHVMVHPRTATPNPSLRHMFQWLSQARQAGSAMTTAAAAAVALSTGSIIIIIIIAPSPSLPPPRQGWLYS